MLIETLHVDKRWGYEKIVVNKSEYCGKMLHMRIGCHTSWHHHVLKDEVLHVSSGRIILYHSFGNDLDLSETVELKVGDSFHVPRGLRHRLTALEHSVIIEFSTQHFDSDSHRLED